MRPEEACIVGGLRVPVAVAPKPLARRARGWGLGWNGLGWRCGRWLGRQRRRGHRIRRKACEKVFTKHGKRIAQSGRDFVLGAAQEW